MKANQLHLSATRFQVGYSRFEGYRLELWQTWDWSDEPYFVMDGSFKYWASLILPAVRVYAKFWLKQRKYSWVAAWRIVSGREYSGIGAGRIIRIAKRIRRVKDAANRRLGLWKEQAARRFGR